MTEITDVKSRIIQLSPAMFEQFCSTLLYKEGHRNIYEIGIKAGTGKTKTGNPDTYSWSYTKKVEIKINNII